MMVDCFDKFRMIDPKFKVLERCEGFFWSRSAAVVPQTKALLVVRH